MPYRCVQCGAPKAPSKRHEDCWEFQRIENELFAPNEYLSLFVQIPMQDLYPERQIKDLTTNTD